VLAILNGKTKPHQFSWLVFVIMNGIVTLSQFLAGGRASVLISLTFFAGSLVNFLLSLKYGTRDTSRWDRLLLGFALFTIAIWVLTKSNAAAIWLTVIIDVAATSMTILKVVKEPHSEDPQAWIIAGAAYIFTCLSLIDKPLGILYVRPLYGLMGDAILVAFIYYFRHKAGRTTETSPLQS
jgi:hypothetical protein